MKKIFFFIVSIFLCQSLFMPAFSIDQDYKKELKRIGYSYNVKGFNKAIQNEDLRAFNYFLFSTVNINSKDKKGFTPLHTAANCDNYDYAKRIVNEDADVSVQNNAGDAPLNYAVYWGNMDLAKLLVENGANVNIKNNYGDTALRHAVMVRKIDFVVYFLP